MDGQGNFFTIYFPGFVCFVLYYGSSHLIEYMKMFEY